MRRRVGAGSRPAPVDDGLQGERLALDGAHPVLVLLAVVKWTVDRVEQVGQFGGNVLDAAGARQWSGWRAPQVTQGVVDAGPFAADACSGAHSGSPFGRVVMPHRPSRPCRSRPGSSCRRVGE